MKDIVSEVQFALEMRYLKSEEESDSVQKWQGSVVGVTICVFIGGTVGDWGSLSSFSGIGVNVDTGECDGAEAVPDGPAAGRCDTGVLGAEIVDRRCIDTCITGAEIIFCDSLKIKEQRGTSSDEW